MLLTTIVQVDNTLSTQGYQAELMRKFFFDISEAFLNEHGRGQALVPKRRRSYNVCGCSEYPPWLGITCKSGEVISVEYAAATGGHFCIEHLPPTVQIVFLESCGQEYTLNTWWLPRELVQFNMAKNFIHGTLDLSGIPQKTKIFRMERNFLTGPIDIRYIPNSLQILSLDDNRIEQEVVYHGMISENMVQMSFRGNMIYHVRAEIPQYRASAKKIKFLINGKAKVR